MPKSGTKLTFGSVVLEPCWINLLLLMAEWGSNPPFSASNSLDLEPQYRRLLREFLLNVQFNVQPRLSMTCMRQAEKQALSHALS